MKPAPFSAKLNNLGAEEPPYLFELADNHGHRRLDVYLDGPQKVYVFSVNPDHSTVVDHGYFGTSLSIEGMATPIDIPVKRGDFVHMMEEFTRHHGKPQRMGLTVRPKGTGPAA